MPHDRLIRIGLFASLAVFVVSTASTAQVRGKTGSSDKNQVTAKLVCGPHSSDPVRLRPFQALLTFVVTEGQLLGSRSLTSNGGGREEFTGTIGPNLVLVSGGGSYASGGSWLYQFAGPRRSKTETVLSGRQESTLGAIGSRQCTLRFLRKQPLI